MNNSENKSWTGLYTIAAISASAIVLVFVIEMVVILSYGLPPTNVEGWFGVLQNNRSIGLIQTFALDLIAVAFHAPLYLGLFFYIRQTQKLSSILNLAVVFAMIGIAIYFSSNITFSMLYLSDQFASASSEAQKSQILASGQTFLAVFNGTGPFVAYFLYAVAGILVSIVMIQSRLIARSVAIAGIIGNTLELGLPPSIDPPWFLQIDPILIAIGGVILIFWYIAIAVKFFRITS